MRSTTDIQVAKDVEICPVTSVDLIAWIGESKRWILGAVAAVGLVAAAYAMLTPPIFTSHTTFLAPGSQQQGGSAAALAALGSLGGLAGGFGTKSPDELYVALLKSDSVQRGLTAQFALKERYRVDNFETLRRILPSFIRISSDKKSGLILVDVDDEDPQFAANLANAHAGEVSKVLARLAVSEAQSRRVFYEKQLSDTKEKLIKAEQYFREVQEKSGVIVLDKQAEALIAGAAQVRAMISEREVQLRVLRTGATNQNPAVMRLTSELAALRSELNRLESKDGALSPSSAMDMPVTKIPGAAVEYVRARREVKLQEALLEGIIRQFELAKLDEAKEGPALQQVDVAVAPDKRSGPSRFLIVVGSLVASFFLFAALTIVFELWRRAKRLSVASGNSLERITHAWRI